VGVAAGAVLRGDAWSDAERALVVAYWMQKVQGESDFDGFTINKELRHLGYAASNITSALTQLIVRKPQLPSKRTNRAAASRRASATELNERGIACRRAIARRRHYRLGLQRAPVA